MAVMIDPENSSLLRATPRLMQILRVLSRHKFLGALPEHRDGGCKRPENGQ